MNKRNTTLIIFIFALIGALIYVLMSDSSNQKKTQETDIISNDESVFEEKDLIEGAVQQIESVKESALPVSSYMGSYNLASEEYKNSIIVTVRDGVRTIVTNALANHETGTFPGPGNPNAISPQNNTYTFTTDPVYTGVAKHSREPGIAINGVKFEPQTAERVTCNTGEEYAVEAIQDVINLGLDINNAHVQPTGAYHYHGTPIGLVSTIDNSEQDLLHVGFARDGHLIYYSQSGAYTPSYVLSDSKRKGEGCTITGPGNLSIVIKDTVPDGAFESDWAYSSAAGELDECNGITIGGQYVYLITDSYPYVGRCLKGEFEEVARGGSQRDLEQRVQRPGRRTQ